MAVNWNVFGGSTPSSVRPPSFMPTSTGGSIPSNDPNWLNSIGQFLNSPAGAAAIQAGGGFLTSMGDRKDAEQQRAQTLGQSKANLLGDLYNADQNRQQSAAQGVLQQDPLGASNNFAARQAFMRDILPQLRNVSFTPSDPAIAAAMPKVTGGLRLPEGGLSPDAFAPFSRDATASALASRDRSLINLDPRHQGANMSQLGLGDQTPLQDSVKQYGDLQLQKQLDEAKSQREAMLRALDNDPTGANGGAPPKGYEYDKKTGQLKKKGGGWKGVLKKIGKGLAFAAPIVAAPFTGGASLAAIGALSGAASGALSGGGLKGAILGGALGGIPMGGGLAAGAARPAIGAGIKQAGTSLVKNPMALAGLYGQVR